MSDRLNSRHRPSLRSNACFNDRLVDHARCVYAQLVAAHVGERGAAQSAIETQDAALAAKLESQIHIVADLNRRVSQIDSAIEEAARGARPMPPCQRWKGSVAAVRRSWMSGSERSRPHVGRPDR
jgi:hypothetical protein